MQIYMLEQIYIYIITQKCLSVEKDVFVVLIQKGASKQKQEVSSAVGNLSNHNLRKQCMHRGTHTSANKHLMISLIVLPLFQ